MSRYWCFTLNNYNSEDIEQLSKQIEGLDYIVFGKETGEKGTKHLQGYCEVKSAKTTQTIKKLLGINKLHVEIAKAKNKNIAINYCKKGEQPKTEWDELKEKGPNFGKNAEVLEFIWKKKAQGQRNDLNRYHELIEMAKNGATFCEISEFDSECAIKYHNGIKTIINEHKIENQKNKLKERMNKIILLDWQNKLKLELEKNPDNRKVIWYVDTEGGCGKSMMTKWLYANTECIMFSNAKTADIAKAWEGERIVIFDLARSLNGECVNFQAIESIKNGMIFSSKYDSKTKVYDQPHVVIFANWPPSNLEALSSDRWDIRYLSKEKDGPKSAKNVPERSDPEDNVLQ